MSEERREVRILVTGGGTGGHVSPALATIGEIRRMAEEPGCTWRPVFRYVGSETGVEKRLAEADGIPFVGVKTGKLRRSRNVIGILSARNIADGFRVPAGVLQALVEVNRFRPDVVFSTGGFVSVPSVVAGAMRGVPVILHEQTVRFGLANRIAGRFARRIALTFEGAIEDVPRALRSRCFVTGNPVRPIIFGGDARRAVTRLGFDPADDALPAIYVTGGAQGSRIINQAVEAALPDLLSICRIVHQCGRQPEGQEQDRDRLEAAVSALAPELRRRYHLAQFIADEIADVFALCDLVVGRSGAGTVTEVAALGKPALFIPLVPTGGDEQTRNARRLVETGAAVILNQADCDGPHLLAQINGMLSDRARLGSMGNAALTLARPDAARDLADAVIRLGGATLAPGEMTTNHAA